MDARLSHGSTSYPGFLLGVVRLQVVEVVLERVQSTANSALACFFCYLSITVRPLEDDEYFCLGSLSPARSSTWSPARPPEATPPDDQVTPAISALVPRLPQPPEATLRRSRSKRGAVFPSSPHRRADRGRATFAISVAENVVAVGVPPPVVGPLAAQTGDVLAALRVLHRLAQR
jgi:hypothetical protein